MGYSHFRFHFPFPFSLFFLDFSLRDHLRSHLLSLDYLSFVHLDFSLTICVFLAFGLFLRSRFFGFLVTYFSGYTQWTRMKSLCNVFLMLSIVDAIVILLTRSQAGPDDGML